MNASDGQLRPGRRYPLHERRLVPVGEIELDQALRASVCHLFPTDAERSMEGLGGAIYPVVERGDRLVLVAGFATFAAQREGGSEWVTVFVLDAANERELFELAGTLALGGRP